MLKLFLKKKIFFFLFVLNTSFFFGQTFTIGSGTSTTGLVPITSSAAYSYSQTIYPASLLTAQGMSPGMAITSIAWYVNTANASTANATWDVYLGNTAQNAFASTTNWIPNTSLSQVFTGSVVPSPVGWKTITLTNPFVWNGSNLVISVDENAASFSSTTTMFRTTTTATNNSIYRGNTLNISPAAPGTATGLLTYYPNIQLGIGCWGTQNNASISLSPSVGCSGSPMTITSTNTSTGTGISYQWQSSPNAINWTNVGTNSPNYSANPTTPLYYQMITSCAYNGSSSTSNQVFYTANPTPNATITASGPITFCQGNSVTLSVAPEIGVIYQWKNNGVNISGANSSSYVATTSGNYTLEATNSTPCSTTSNQVSVTVSPTSFAGTVSANQSICAGTSPANITLLGNTGTIQWQVSTDNVNFSNILGATASPLTSAQMGTLTATRYYRAVVTSGSCPSITSNVVTVSVSPASVGGVASANQTICSGSSPADITLVGNVGTIQWQFSSDNLIYNNIIGATSSTLTSAQMGNLTATQYYRAVVNSGNCAYALSNVITKTVSPISVAGTANANQSICTGTTPTSITLTGYTGTIQWQVSTDNITFNTIAGATAATLTGAQMGVLNATRYYRAVVTSGACGSAISNVVTKTVSPTTVAGSASANQTICSGTSPANITLSGNIGTVQWYFSSNNIAYNIIPGATATTLTSAQMGNLTATQYYRATVTSGACASANSNVITVTVNPATVSGSVSANQTICSGTSPSNIVITGSTGTIQWQVSTDNVSFTSITGATASTLTSAQMGSLSSTRYYRAIVTSGVCGFVNSNVVIVTVNPIPTMTSSNSVATCSGVVVNFPLTSNTIGTAFSWVASNNLQIIGESLSAVSSSNISDVLINNTAGASNVAYTISPSFTSGGVTCTGPSQLVSVTVNILPTSAISVSGPTTFCSGNSVTLTTNSGTGFSYQWKNNGVNIPSATSQSYIATVSGNYTVLVTNNNGCSVTSAATIVTVSGSVGGTASANQTICTGTLPSNITLTGNTGTIQWQVSTDNVNFTNISGATTAILTAAQIGTLTATRYFRAVVTSGVCSSSNSNIVAVTVSPTSEAGIASVNQTICSGSSPNSLSLNGNIGAIQWQVSTDNVSFSSIPGATTSTLTSSQMGTLSTTRYYRAIVTSATCASVNSNVITISVNPIPNAVNSAVGATTFCQGSSVNLIANTGTGLSYQWNLNNLPISGQNNSSYTANSSGNYSVTVTNGFNCSSTSNSTQVVVNSNPAIPLISTPNPTSFCLGYYAVLSAPLNPSLSYQWQNNGVNISNATSNQFTASNSGNYSLLVTNANNCSTSSAIQTITVYTLPTSDISALGSTSICLGDSIVLQGNHIDNGNYIWLNQNVIIPNSNTSSFVVFETGSYSYQILDSNNCSNQSDSILVVVNTPNSSEMYTTSLGPFLLNGTTYTESGVYTQNLQTVNGCDSILTLYLEIENASINELNKECDLEVYPNPITDNVLYFTSSDDCPIELIAIIDIFGRQVKFVNVGNKIELAMEAKGIFYLVFRDNDGIFRNKLILH